MRKDLFHEATIQRKGAARRFEPTHVRSPKCTLLAIPEEKSARL
jgi:hypothetical protein